MEIRVDDLSDPRIASFLEEHLSEMQSVSPPESTHALDLDGLKKPEITFWSIWEDQKLVGCGALKELSQTQGEIKSMRVPAELRGRGIAHKLLSHIVSEAASRGYRDLGLETGSMAFFEPARKLYERFGFVYCEPFGEYRKDPNSVFMSMDISSYAASAREN